MAIQFARARYISRSSGGSAVRSAAYNGREAITAERTGELYYFRHRDAPEHHAVLLPEGAAERFAEAGVLWNAAEAAERRKDAQVAREIVLALPADREVTTEDRIALARSFAEEHFVSKGLAVQLDVHAPHPGPGPHEAAADSERGNWHAHLLISTRRLEGEGFAARKARDLDPEVRLAGGRARVADGAAWGELWRAHQDRYFREHGLDLQVDPTATYAGQHIGPVRMRKTGAEIVERAAQLRQANEAAARDPAQVLATLTRNNATFTERDVDRHLGKHIADEAERAAVKAKLFAHPELAALHDRDTGEAAGRFTTRTVRDEERHALFKARLLAHMRTGAVSAPSAAAALAEQSLRPDQAAAFAHATGAGHLKLIEGRAGTGKSYTLAAIRDAHERDGKRVVGLAPTNAVAQDLAQDGFGEARTVHAALFALKNGRPVGGRPSAWDRRTVVVVDEAAMLDTRITGELLAAARDSGAKLIIAGDDRQLASIERGGLFSVMRERHGAAAITEVTRQTADWQRQAARDLAEGRFAEAVGAFDKAGAITWTDTQLEARGALVEAWKRDGLAHPGASRFVFAYTNRDVDALNAELRQVRRARGELAGADVRLATKHGAADFAVGDRVQFTETRKDLRIYNGHAGTITRMNAATGEITARLDAAGKPGREVTWSVAEFQGFRHGYAGTIYKGQGKTLDRTYLYHTGHWRAAASYVALTRQRDSAEMFVARETARDAGQLARQMARGEVRAASVAWATHEELAARRARQPGRDEDPLRGKVRARERAGREARPEPVSPAAAEREAGAGSGPTPAARTPLPPARPLPPLLPAYRDPAGQGRDSLGRGLDAGSIAEAVAGDMVVRRERDSLQRYLEVAYRDPPAAHAALQGLLKREGVDGAAAQIRRDPGQPGELRGKAGWFASAASRREREKAESFAMTIPYTLQCVDRAEAQARRDYAGGVERQKARDAIAVPGLSAAALDVLRGVQTALQETGHSPPEERYSAWQRRQEEAVAAAWDRGQADPDVAAELERFMNAVHGRLGDDGSWAAMAARDQGRMARGATRGSEAGVSEVASWAELGRRGQRLGEAREQRREREAEQPEHERDRLQRGLGWGR